MIRTSSEPARASSAVCRADLDGDALVAPDVVEGVAVAAGDDDVGEGVHLLDERLVERADLHGEAAVGEQAGADGAGSSSR